MEDGGVDQVRQRREHRAKQASQNSAALADHVGHIGVADASAAMVLRGVTIGWLATAFGMDTRTVSARLKECPALKKKPGGSGYVYDLATAAQYLVKPVFDVEEYMKTVKVEELPIRFQEGFWGAQIKKQKWEEAAKELWRTPQVVKTFSETFLMIKGKHDQWLDHLESRVEVSPAVRKVLETEVRDLQRSLIVSIEEMQRHIKPTSAEMPDDRPKDKKKTDDDDILADINDVI